MILMHGLFDLKADIEDGEFRESFDVFSKHLKDVHLVISSRFMRHQAHDGYNARAPLTKYYVSMEFADMDNAEQCWTYIQSDEEPVRTLHTAVFSKIQNHAFFLTSDI